jgi:anti-sigma28 factor (negative regulator of flagellin synthesis)
MKIDTMNNLLNVNSTGKKVDSIKTNIQQEPKGTTQELSRVEQIKIDMANGTYKIDLNQLANKIAEDLLN